MDLALALWAYSSRRQHPTPPAWPIRVCHILAAPSHSHSNPPAWRKGVGCGNLLVASLGEILYSVHVGSIYRQPREVRVNLSVPGSIAELWDSCFDFGHILCSESGTNCFGPAFLRDSYSVLFFNIVVKKKKSIPYVVQKGPFWVTTFFSKCSRGSSYRKETPSLTWTRIRNKNSVSTSLVAFSAYFLFSTDFIF